MGLVEVEIQLSKDPVVIRQLASGAEKAPYAHYKAKAKDVENLSASKYNLAQITPGFEWACLVQVAR